jgi:purine-cytosine permease-like protein
MRRNSAGDNILRDTLRSIKRLTLPARAIAAIAGVGLGAGIFAGCYFSSLPTRLLQIPGWGARVLDFTPLLVAEILGWAIINIAMYFDLHRHFPNTKIGFKQSIGKTGYGTLMAIVVTWFGALALSPVRPPWLSWLSTLVHK